MFLNRMAAVLAAAILATGLMAATWFFVQAQQPAQADINDDPFRGGATVSTEGQQQEEFRQLIRSEARQLSYWLAVASGAGVECDDTCERVDDPVQVWEGVAARCSKLEAWTLAEMARSIGPEDEEIATALAMSCDQAVDAVATMGRPSNDAAWQDAARGAAEPLAAALDTTEA